MFTREAPPPASTSVPRFARFSDLLLDWEAEATAAHTARLSGMPRGPVTGLAPLDRELGGGLSAGLHIIHGSPGSGKSALSLQIAAVCGAPALFLTCEMRALELFRRHTARATGTYLGRLRSGELAPADSIALARRAAAAAPLLAVADATYAWAPAQWIKDAAEATRGAHDHLLIVIDSVHAWADAMPDPAPEYERLNGALASLRGLAGALSCPVLVVAERNRSSMAVGGLSAGAGTRKIEYGADTVLDLAVDDKTVTTVTGETSVVVTLAKNRNGSPGRKVPLRFHGALQQFVDGALP
jgi:replicative DNA helicase